jgi:hypothetical protein
MAVTGPVYYFELQLSLRPSESLPRPLPSDLEAKRVVIGVRHSSAQVAVDKRVDHCSCATRVCLAFSLDPSSTYVWAVEGYSIASAHVPFVSSASKELELANARQTRVANQRTKARAFTDLLTTLLCGPGTSMPVSSTVYEAWGPRRNNSESASYQMQDCEVLLPKQRLS